MSYMTYLKYRKYTGCNIYICVRGELLFIY